MFVIDWVIKLIYKLNIFFKKVYYTKKIATLIRPQFISSEGFCCITLACKFPRKSVHRRIERAKNERVEQGGRNISKDG